MTEQRTAHHGAERWLIGQTAPARRLLAGAVAAVAVGGSAMIVQARLLAGACHRIVIDHQQVNAIIPLAAGIALLALLRGGCAWVSERLASRAACRIRHDLRTRLYRRLHDISPLATGRDTGELVEAVTAGVDGIETYVARFLPQVALSALLPLAVLLVVAPSEWRAGLVLLFSAPFIPLFMVLIGKGAESLNRQQWGRLARMAGRLLDLVQGLPDLKAFGAVKREAALLRQVSDDYRVGTMAILRVAFLSAFTLEFFSTVGTALVAVIIGFRLLSGGLGLADGLFVLLLAPEFYLPLRNLGLSYHARLQGSTAAELLLPLMSLEPPSANGTRPAPAAAPAISFESVTYCYASGRGGVHGIDLQFPAGSLTVLAGESGSGKTTMMRLLAGFALPQEGTILIDGVRLDQIDRTAWRRSVAWVPQQPFFFAGSVRDNLLLGCPGAPEEEIRRALGVCGAEAFVARLDQQLGGRASGVSGGELKRLALARALLRRSQVLVLDEPTAGLDGHSERLVAETIRRLAGERTILVISHREETIRLADRVAVLAGGALERVVAPDLLLSDAGGAA